jgi:hypothetical protein
MFRHLCLRDITWKYLWPIQILNRFPGLITLSPIFLAAATTGSKAQAAKAAKALKKGVVKKKTRKIRTSVTFHRPKTLKRVRDPKYPRLSAPRPDKLDHYQVGMLICSLRAAAATTRKGLCCLGRLANVKGV